MKWADARPGMLVRVQGNVRWLKGIMGWDSVAAATAADRKYDRIVPDGTACIVLSLHVGPVRSLDMIGVLVQQRVTFVNPKQLVPLR